MAGEDHFEDYLDMVSFVTELAQPVREIEKTCTSGASNCSTAFWPDHFAGVSEMIPMF